MEGSPLSLPPASTDLKDPFITRGKEPFRAELRRSLKKPVGRRDGIDIGFRGRGRDTVGSLYFGITATGEKLPDGLKNICPLFQGILAPDESPVLNHGLSPIARTDNQRTRPIMQDEMSHVQFVIPGLTRNPA